MSLDPKYGRYCDECGKIIDKAHRVFENKDYCASCYPRVFIKAACSKCGEPARVHKHAKCIPLCRTCTLAGRVCVRCEKPVLRAGMLSEGKPVCPSCAPHFRVPHPCNSCGILSSRLSAMPSLGIFEKICESCRNKITHRTCSVCQKHRKVAGIRANGRPYCASCMPGAETTHRCPSCNAVVPGSGASRCRSCSNQQKITKEFGFVQATLTRDWTKKLYMQFGTWLYEKQPMSSNLVKVLRAHQIFFERVDAQCPDPKDMTESELLAIFGVSGMRKHCLPSQFVTDLMGLNITTALKVENVESDRILSKLQANKRQSWGYLLYEYASWMADTNIPMRTRRLYLTAAEAFCSYAKLSHEPWTQDRIGRFLKQKPGLRASLYKFVGYCKRAYEWDVTMPQKAEMGGQKNSVPKTVSVLSKLLKKVSADGVNQVDKRTLARILAKSLGLPINIIMDATRDQFQDQFSAHVFLVNEELIEIPPELNVISHAYVAKLS